jgi:peptidoglycan/LPS O-acetylase OafA/YrhL
LGFALACWGVILTGSILVGVLVTFHELASPFTAPDIVAFLGELVVGVALFRSKRWGYRLGLFLTVYLSALGALLLVAPTPEFSQPDLLFGSKMFWWVYAAPGALLLLALVAPASRRWHEWALSSPRA